MAKVEKLTYQKLIYHLLRCCSVEWCGKEFPVADALSSFPSLSFQYKNTFPLLLRLLGSSMFSFSLFSSSAVHFLGTVFSLLPPNKHPCGFFAFSLPVQSHRMCTEKTNCRDKLVCAVHDWSRAKYLNFRCLQRDFSLTFPFKRKIIKHYHYFRSKLYCFWSKAVVRFTK